MIPTRETITHFLFDCPAYQDKWHYLNASLSHWNKDLEYIMSKRETIWELLWYIRRTKRLKRPFGDVTPGEEVPEPAESGNPWALGSPPPSFPIIRYKSSRWSPFNTDHTCTLASQPTHPHHSHYHLPHDTSRQGSQVEQWIPKKKRNNKENPPLRTPQWLLVPFTNVNGCTKRTSN